MNRLLRAAPIWVAIAALPTVLAAEPPSAKWVSVPKSESPAPAVEIAAPPAAGVALDDGVIMLAYGVLALAAALLLVGRLVEIAAARGYRLPRPGAVRVRHRDDPFDRLCRDAQRR